LKKAAKGLAALPIVTLEAGRARTPLRAGDGTTNRQMRLGVRLEYYCEGVGQISVSATGTQFYRRAFREDPRAIAFTLRTDF